MLLFSFKSPLLGFLDSRFFCMNLIELIGLLVMQLGPLIIYVCCGIVFGVLVMSEIRDFFY